MIIIKYSYHDLHISFSCIAISNALSDIFSMLLCQQELPLHPHLYFASLWSTGLFEIGAAQNGTGAPLVHTSQNLT